MSLILDTADKIVDAADNHVGYLIHRFEDQVGYRPLKVAVWGFAAATVMGAVAAGLGAVAAGAGAYVAVKAAKRSREADAKQSAPIAGELSPVPD